MQTLAQMLVDAVSLGGLYALLSLGIALIFGILKLINFAYGELLMVGGYTLFLLGDIFLALAITGSILVVVVASLAMDRVAFRPIRDADITTMLVTSFAVGFLLKNAAILIFGSFPVSTGVGNSLDQSFRVLGLRVSGLNVIAIVVTAVVLLALGYANKYTSVGIQMRAAAEDLLMARTLGVRADRIIALGFATSGLLAGVASFFLVARTGSISPLFGVAPLLVALIATILGGIGSLAGAVVAGFGLGFLTTVLQQLLPPGVAPYRDALVFALVLLTLLVRPQGLLPTKTSVERV